MLLLFKQFKKIYLIKSILFFKSKEFHMFILVVDLNLAKCRLPKGPKFVFKF